MNGRFFCIFSLIIKKGHATAKKALPCICGNENKARRITRNIPIGKLDGSLMLTKSCSGYDWLEKNLLDLFWALWCKTVYCHS